MAKTTSMRALWALVIANTLLGTFNFIERYRGAVRESLAAHRIEVVDNDGGLRLVIASPDDMPGVRMDGTEIPRVDRGAGLLFYNAEGDEVGGLTFDGKRSANGVRARGGLMFDQFKQDQTIGLAYSEDAVGRVAALHVWDRPNTPVVALYNRAQAIAEIPNEQERIEARRALLREAEIRRVFLGRRADTSAGIEICDQAGRPRIRMFVDDAGQPSLEFLDANGIVTRDLEAAH